MGVDNQCQLAGYGINGIYNIVVLCEIKLCLCLREIENLVGGDGTGGVNGEDSLLGHLHLAFSYAVMGGKKLPVDIGQGDCVAVNQIQSAHTGAGQGLHCISAHAPHTKHRHPGGGQLLHSLPAEKKLCSGKLIWHRASPHKHTNLVG